MKKVSVPPKLEQDYKILIASVESLIEQHKTTAPKKSREKVQHEWQPGIDFRQLSIHPLPQDLLFKSDVNICPVVIEGPYKSVEHYLDVQFNLMREDFLIPLREGIANYVEQKSSKSNKFKRIENVRFYNNVWFLGQVAHQGAIVTKVDFNGSKKASKHNWNTSKRLLYGSLLCFTSNSFNSVILGVIVGSKVDMRGFGILHCELIGDVRDEGLFKKEFIMAESEVYFEPYQHVMRALQNFNEWNFPLKEYIIGVSSYPQLPTYLDRYLHYNDLEFLVSEEHFLPPMEHLEVNESQFRALYSALTKECAVIQGPPGTGKTYLGLKIAKLLLENSNRWRRWGKGPILVVCFTNHALDQFLEGMLSFTRKIVRIGSQSKSEKLISHNLSNLRYDKSMADDLRRIKCSLQGQTNVMKEYNDLLNECKRNVGIISLEHLHHSMDRCHYSWFTKNNIHSDLKLLEWLLTGAYFQSSSNSYQALDDIDYIPESKLILYACTLHEINHHIGELKREAVAAEGYELESINNILMMEINRFNYMQNKLAERFEPNLELIKRLSMVRNLNGLHPEHRWVLYKYWVSEAIVYCQRIIMRRRQMYQALNEEKSEMLEGVRLEWLNCNDVVGMTTTAAARHQSLLRNLGCKIVIVEEAAEAMESHIVVSLSSKCEHLILIGDHKQLRPSPAVYKLAKDYNLEISLFERLLMNGISCDTLTIQHRMRPDIADLIFPAVYPVLENHPTVMEYDNVRGLKKNLYFITHSHLEQRSDGDSSKKNPHEAEFLIALCKHIILQGYDPSQITILAAYLGQMFLLTEERENDSILDGVKITAVDNYQGEENDIILLSLVRNNEEGKIGFLASENRTCVALSRAKMGLYIIGNIDLLAGKSRLWSQIRKVLQEKEAVGTHLMLQCVKHPEQLTEVSKAEDFNGLTEGGCSLMCMEKLNCGHICMEKCHTQGHDVYTCQETCNKVICIHEHRCQKLCWETCGDCMVAVESDLPCGHKANLPCHSDPEEYKCIEVVSVKLPGCDHTNEKLCHVDLIDVQCSFSCDSRLPCGHACTDKCHVSSDPEHLEYKCLKPCSRKNLKCKDEHMCQRKCHEECGTCTVKVKRKLPYCDHYFDMECCIEPSTIECHKPCKKKLDCGHECQRECKDPCGGCPKIVEKEIPDCKHRMNVKCCEVPLRSMCKEKCTKILSCGHTCMDICGFQCNENKCEFLSSRVIQAQCGHDVSLFCHEVNSAPSAVTLMERCKEPCSKILECSHRCKGMCGQCLQGRIHIPCREKCERNLICGHKCTVLCSQACPPCTQNCLICCEHSKCKSKCGTPCSPCQEKCGWQCEHQTCGKKCSDLCDRPPCNEPCKKILKCGHECIGFCGEKCPDLCRVCNPEEVKDTLTFLGVDGDENSRFVLLPDCGHVFESTGLDKWLSVDDGLVKMLECPMCKVPIQQAYRHGRNAKLQIIHTMNVKFRVFGNLKDISKKVMKLGTTLSDNLSKSEEFKTSRSSLDELLALIRKNEKAHYSAFVLNSLETRTEFVLSIVENFKYFKDKISEQQALQDCMKTANLLIKMILSRLDSISMQEHNDLEGECMRFHLLMNLRSLENATEFKNSARADWYQEYEKCRVAVEESKPFPKDKYVEIGRKIKEVCNELKSRVTYFSSWNMVKVVPAFDLHQGHWYMCPNGHIFVFSECGQAVQTERCNECRD